MTKLIALAPFSLILVACATSPMHRVPMSEVPVQNAHKMQTAAETPKAYDRMMPDMFTCEDDGAIQAKYSLDGEQAVLNVSLPKVQWDNQTLYLDTAVSGSGSRYVNEISDDVTYEWHSKGDFGIMNIDWADGTTYKVNCNRK